jgi:hypothetical protein
VGGSGVLSFAGCGAPTWWCDVYHRLAWALGGETSLENTALRCERHHTQVDAGSFTNDRDPTGHWHTYRRDGSEIHVLHPLDHDPPTTRAG